jgi:hypothetical protein
MKTGNKGLMIEEETTMRNYDYIVHSLYPCAHSRARWHRLWATLTGRPARLLSLAEVEVGCTVSARCSAGVQMVSIRQIKGSGGRRYDFDNNFNPLRPHNRQRWLRIARAWQRGAVLPPVALIQVGDVYFVRDGHHRISVARAMGRSQIEAKVTVWQVSGSFPH